MVWPSAPLNWICSQLLSRSPVNAPAMGMELAYRDWKVATLTTMTVPTPAARFILGKVKVTPEAKANLFKLMDAVVMFWIAMYPKSLADVIDRAGGGAGWYMISEKRTPGGV